MPRRPSRRLLVLAVLALLAGGLIAALEGRGRARIEIPARHGSPPPLSRPLGAAVSLDPAQHDDAYLRDLLATFSSITPENAMKWAEIEPERGSYRFAGADAIARLARATGKRLRGHTLVWDQQLPDWLTGRAWSRDELRRVLAEHIRAVAGHYRGRVESWDVVNEPFENDGSLTPSLWERVLGPGYIALAFRLAHEADPHARLFLNEVAAERPGRKQDALVALVRRLRADGVPIDGVGLQNHTTVGGHPDAAQLERTMRRLTSEGVDVEITEMDVVIPLGEPTTEALLERQADAYAQAARACAAVRRCTGLTVWGVTDDRSWLGADRRPLLFGADGKPKPARDAVLAALRPPSG